MKNKAETKVQKIGPQFVTELDNLMQKGWDMSGDGATNELWSSEFKAFLDGVTLKSLFFSEDWVYIIVDLAASKISSQPLRVVKSVVQGDETVLEPVPEHPLNALLRQPNEWQDYAQWMYNTVVELLLMGNSVMWHAPRSGQILTIPTETISMDFDAKSRIRGYMVHQNQEESGFGVPLQTFKPENIIHVRRPNPSSLLWGLSPFIPGRKSVLFNRYSTDYLNAFYLKQATPGLALSLDRSVNEDVALRQLRSFESAYQGRKNQRRTLILPKGVTATTLTHSLSDQKLIDHINQNRETIIALLKVPKHEVGLQTAGSLGSEEYKTALRNFWEASLIPAMKFIEGALTKFFQKELGEGTSFKFDLSGVEALKEDMKMQAEIAVQLLNAGLTINEVRQRIWKQEPSTTKGSDDPYILVGKLPVFGAPAAAAPAPAIEEPEAKMLPQKTKLTMTPQIENFRNHVVKQLIDEEESTLGVLAKSAVELLVGMTAEAIDVVLESNKSAPAMKALPPKRVLSRRIQKALSEKFEEEWKDQVAKTLMKSVELGYSQQLQLVFNEKDRAAVEALRERDAKGRRIILEARGLEAFDQISKTHTERIMAAIEKGTAEGQSVSRIMRSVAELLGTPGQLAGKAETIARTETLTAVSIGQAAAMKNAKEVIPGLKKAWLTAGDNRVRDSHAALQGDVVDVDEKFENGLSHPRDVESTDPAEVINCRCTLLMIPPGETLEIPKT